MPDDQLAVLRSDADGLCTLTLNRPDKLNALTPGSFVALREHLDSIAADDSVRCVVLRGAGRSFCAGHDLEAIASGERAPSRHFESETVDALEQLPQPTIARLHGHCFRGAPPRARPAVRPPRGHGATDGRPLSRRPAPLGVARRSAQVS
jgi:enoyl-CoA hydratase/carnithine racemase